MLFVRTTLRILPGWFALCVADKLKDATAHCVKAHTKRAVEVDDGCEAAIIRNLSGGRIAFVCTRRHLCHDVIAHELRHATDRFLEYAGVHPSHEGNETAAYLTGWLTQWV